MKSSLKSRYFRGTLNVGRSYSPKPYRRETQEVKSLDVRVVGAVFTSESKSA
jgi:hypothetical protein